MSICSKQIIAIILLLAASNQTLANNTTPTNEEPRQRPNFASIDLNADGDIDFNEFSSHKLPRGDHQTVFGRIDTDNNGIISHKEFVDHKPPQRKNRKEDQ